MFIFKNVAIKVLCLLLAFGCTACRDEDTADPTNTTVSVAQSQSVTSQPLSITGQPAAMVDQGAVYYFKAQATGGGGATRVFAIQNKPDWASFNASTGELSGTPQAGTYANVVVSVSDGITSTQLPAFAITVKAGTSVTLSWTAPDGNTDGSPLNGLRGYVIHYGTSSNALNERIDVGSANISSYTLTGLKPGVTYYFGVTAVNELNMGGELSEVVSTTV